MNKKAQHEIVGFVLIVLIVSVIGIIFLALAIGRGDNRQTSVEISNLLQASMYYTTDCAVNFIPQYREGQDLIKECYKDSSQKCLNGKLICNSLKDNFKKIIDNGLRVSPDSQDKAYTFKAYFVSLYNSEDKQDILNFEEGVFENCTTIPGGSHSISISRFGYGTINIELEVCRG